MTIRRLSVVAVALVVAACGSSGGGSHTAHDGGTRTVNVTMRDNDFDPPVVAVERGETITFVFSNKGAVVHDAFVGDEAAQLDHEREMASSGSGMPHEGHGDAVTVEPGMSGELTHTFDQPGITYIGCHEPGHYKAGMKIRVTVT